AIVFLFLAVSMALGVLTLGQAATYFAAAGGCFFLLVAGAVFRTGISDVLAEGARYELLYRWLPPLGEIIFDLSRVLETADPTEGHLALWFGWTLVAVGAFCWRLRYPLLWRAPD